MKRLGRFILWSMVVVLVFCGLVWLANNDSKTKWANYEAEQRKKGLEVFWKKPLQPDIPDEQNFARNAVFQAIGTKSNQDIQLVGTLRTLDEETGFEGGNYWNQKLSPLLSTNRITADRKKDAEQCLNLLEEINPIFEELYSTVSRPHNFLKIPDGNPFFAKNLDFNAIQNLIHLLVAHASANLATGKGDFAIKDLHALLKIAQSFESIPTFLYAMIETSIAGLAMQIVWEGISLQQWNSQQLEQVRTLLKEVNLVASYDRAMRGERRMVSSLAIEANSPYGSGFTPEEIFFRNWEAALFRNLILYNQLMEDHILKGYDRAGPTISPRIIDANFALLQSDVQGERFFNFLPRLAIPNVTLAVRTLACNQAAVQLATFACTLEEIKAKEGNYPDKVDEQLIPKDVVTGRPLLYRRAGSRYVIYSAAWNAKDDGGVVDGKVGTSSADWVWAYER